MYFIFNVHRQWIILLTSKCKIVVITTWNEARMVLGLVEQKAHLFFLCSLWCPLSTISIAHFLGNHPRILSSLLTLSPYNQNFFHLVTLTVSPADKAILGSSVQGGRHAILNPIVHSGSHAPEYSLAILYSRVRNLFSAFCSSCST